MPKSVAIQKLNQRILDSRNNNQQNNQTPPTTQKPSVKPKTGVTNRRTTTPTDTRRLPSGTQQTQQQTQQQTAQPSVLNTPIVLSNGTVVNPAQSYSQRTGKPDTRGTDDVAPAMNQLITSVTDTARQQTKDELKGKSIAELHKTVSTYTHTDEQSTNKKYIRSQDNSTIYNLPQYLKDSSNKLNSFYASEVQPKLDAYNKANEALKNGTGSYEDALAAWQDYENARRIYQPQQEAWDTLTRDNTRSYWDNGDLERIGADLSLYDEALQEGNTRIGEMQTHLSRLGETYTTNLSGYESAVKKVKDAEQALKTVEKAVKSGKMTVAQAQQTIDNYSTAWSELEAAQKALDDSALELNDYQGQYQAAAMYLDDMLQTSQYASDTYRKRYLEAHPEVTWANEAGVSWNEQGQIAGIGMSFDELFDYKLQLEENNTDGQNSDEIAFYNSLLLTGLGLAQMSSEQINSRQEYFNKIQTDAGAVMSQKAFDYINGDHGIDPSMLPTAAGSTIVEEALKDDPEYAAAKAKYDEAQYWLNQLNSKEYEAAYEHVLDNAPDYVMSSLDDYISAWEDAGIFAKGVEGSRIDRLDKILRSALRQGTDLTEEQIEGVVQYAQRQADAVHQAEVHDKWYNWATQLPSELGDVRSTAAGAQYSAAFGGAMPKVARKALEEAQKQSNGSTDPKLLASIAMYQPVAVLNSLLSGGGAVDLALQGAGNLTGATAVDPMTGKPVPLNYNTNWHTPYQVVKALNEAEYNSTYEAFFADLGDQEQAQKKAQMYNNWYNLSVSMGQSTAIMALSMVGVPGAMLLLSGSAAEQTMQDLHEQGYSDGYAVVGGIISGFAEHITESYSLESLLKVADLGKMGLRGTALLAQLGINFGNQALAEGSEEGASDIVNYLADKYVLRLLNGGVSQIEMDALRKRQENPNLTYEESMRESFADWTKQTGQDIFYGGVSGALMGPFGYGIGEVSSSFRQSQLGADIRNAGEINTLYDIAAGIDSLSQDLGQGLDTDRKIGRLAERVRDSQTRESIRGRLEELGETDISDTLLRAIDAEAADQRLLPSEKRALRSSEHANQVARELADYYDKEDSAKQWTQQMEKEQKALTSILTSPVTGIVNTRTRANELEMRWQETRNTNPDATVLNPISEQIAAAGADARVANTQGRLLAKVFSGENLNAKELRALDLNNPAVRAVFAQRSGLTGIPTGKISNSLKQTYVNRISAESRVLIESQKALEGGSELLAELTKERSAGRMEALKAAAKETENPMDKHFGNKRAANAEQRAEEKATNYEAKKKEAARSHAIPTEGRSPGDIIRQVQQQSGTNVLAYDAFVQYASRNGVDITNRTAVDNAYIMYLRESGLTTAEVNAMVTASNMLTGGASNEVLLSGDAGRDVQNNERKGAGRVRSDSKGKTGSSKELGVPEGSERGELTEVTAEEAQKSQRIRSAIDFLSKHGVESDKVHFVKGNGDFIYINRNGVDLPVRGVYDSATQEIWILVDDSSAAHLTPRRIAAHEIFHHYVSTMPGLFDAIVEQMKADNVYDAAVEAAQRYAGGTQVYDESDIRAFLEEVMADAHANVNTITGADARQFTTAVRKCVQKALIKNAPKSDVGYEIRTSAIETTPENWDEHHDNLGRKLAKGMDEFMKDSWMRESLQDFVDNGVVPVDQPLTTMYQGGGLGYDTFPEGRMTFWSNRPEISRTYSAGKYPERTTTTHVQDATKGRQLIAQLEDEYKRLGPYAYIPGENRDRFKQVEQELLAAHKEIEPFSKDIYAPSRNRNVFPELPTTIEEAEKLINRYGADNRSAKIVPIQSVEEIIEPAVDGLIDKVTPRLTRLARFIYKLHSEVEEDLGPDAFDAVEAELGTPYWLDDDSDEDSSSEMLSIIDELNNIAGEAAVALVDYTDAKSHTISDMYELFETLSQIDGYDIMEIAQYAFASSSDFKGSYELLELCNDYVNASNEFGPFDWGEVTAMARNIYNVMNEEGSTAQFRGLDVRGKGIQHLFSSDQDVINYAQSLYTTINNRGIYSCFLNITKPFILDCKGKAYSNLGSLSDESFPDKQAIGEWKYGRNNYYDGGSIRSRDIGEWASDQVNSDGSPKYDGVILLNVVDYLDGWDEASMVIGDATSTVAITWKPEVPKSTANTNPTGDSRITYSAVEDTDAAVQKALKEFEPSENRSDALNNAITRLKNGETVSIDELMSVPEIASAESKSTRGKDTEKLPEWESEIPVAVSNFQQMGSYNSEAAGKGTQKWTGPVDRGHKAFIVIGPPAAGKSTIAVNELSEQFHARILDKDEYRTSFTGNKNHEDASRVEKPSGDVRKKLEALSRSVGENVVWPQVGRSYEWLQEDFRRFRRDGYEVYLVYVNVERNSAMARSLVRSFPSDGSPARYTNVGYAEEAATSPGINFELAKNDTFTDDNGVETPMIAGYAMFDNSVLGRNAVLVENTIPGFRDNEQKGAANDQGRADSRGSGPRAESGVSGQGVRDLSGLGRDTGYSVESVGDNAESGRGNSAQLGGNLRTSGEEVKYSALENIGPNTDSAVRNIKTNEQTKQKNKALRSAKTKAEATTERANEAASGPKKVRYNHSRPFSQQVDDFADFHRNGRKVWRFDDSLVMGGTPGILKKLDFPSLPLTYNEGHMARIIDIWDDLQDQLAHGVDEKDLRLPKEEDWDHAFGPDVIKQLPQLLESPIAVIRSAPTKSNQSAPQKSVLVYTDKYDNGQPVRAVISPNASGQDNGRTIDACEVTSAHRSSYAASVLNAAIDAELAGDVVGVYCVDFDKLRKVPGIDKEKVDELLSRAKNLRLGTSEGNVNFLHSITDPKAEVKLRTDDSTHTDQFIHWFNGSDLTTTNENGQKVPRVLYHVANADTAARTGVGYRVTYNEEDGAQPVYGWARKSLRLAGAPTGTDASGILRQIMLSDFDKAFKDVGKNLREKLRSELPGEIMRISKIKNTTEANQALAQYLHDLGLDSIRYKGKSGTELILLGANQIKSVDNTGLYSTDTAGSIHYSAVDTEAEKNRADKLKAAEAARTDRQWAYGMKSSEKRAGKAETKRRTAEAVALDRAIHSLPATAAVKNRRAVRKADQVPINDNQVIATPLPSPDNSGITLPKSSAEFSNLFKQGYDKFYRAMVNAVQEVDRMAKLQTRTDNLSVWVNVVRAASSTIQRFYTDAMLDKHGNAIGPSMEEVFLCRDELGNYDQKLQNALNDYMFHKHNIDRMSLESRARDRVKAFEQKHPWILEQTDSEFARLVSQKVPLALEYAQLLKEAAEAKNKPVLADVKGKPVTAESSQRVVDVYESDMPWLKEKAQEIYDWWDVFMREWAVGTSITEEQYDHMREIYPHYVPTYRVDKGQHAGYISGTATGITSGEMVKAAKGSVAPLQAMEDQFVKSMTQIVTNNRKNGFLQNLIEELQNNEDGRFSQYGVYDNQSTEPALEKDLWDFADETEEASVKKVKIDGQDAYRVSCWVNGEKKTAYVNRAMFEGINFLFGRTSDTYNTVAKIGRTITQPMKDMITGYNPTFAIKNIIRDQHTALTNSNAGKAYWRYLAKAAAKINENDSDWVNFQALGGVASNENRVEGGFAEAMHPATGVNKAISKGKEWLGKPGEITESVSRFAEYLAMLDILGGDTTENRMAALRASAEVTIDFGRSGSIGRLINMWVPYWNANVQGLDKAIRNIAEQPDVKSMLKRTLRAVLVNLIPTAIQIAIIKALHREKDYEELSDQQKDNYYCIPIIGMEHKFLKIPKSQDWSAFFSTPIIRIWEGVEGRDNPMEGWFESAVLPNMPFDMRDIGLGGEMPVILPVFLDDLLDVATNKNWAGSAIIPYNLQKASPREQFDADTSLLAYYFGQVFDKSPMAIDYIIDNYMGNFFGIAAKVLPTPFMSRGLVTGETKFTDKAIDAASTIMSPFVSDNRYSSHTLANYYEMINELEQEVTDAGVHGDKKDAEHYDIYQALTQTGGYVDQIRAITNKARGLVRGGEQSDLRWEVIGLANEALEFANAVMSGEIEDPEHWMTYHLYGDTIMNAATELKELESTNGGDFNFSGKLGEPKTIWNRSGDQDIKWELDIKKHPGEEETYLEAQEEYKRLRAQEYKKALELVINSDDYKNATPAGKAARLEDAKQAGLKKADQLMLQYLRESGINGDIITKTDYSEEERAAAYSVSWLMGEQNAYKPELTDAFVELYDYNDQYSFIPSESTKKTFKDPADGSKVYTLNSEQQQEYADIYHDVVTEFYEKVMATKEYQEAGAELRAAMLSRAKSQYVNEEVKARFAKYLSGSGAVAVTTEKASADISLEAKYALQRAMGDDHAMRKEVTDELVRLYQYADVGEVQYFPITTAPKSYVDDKNKDYMWVLDDTQREMYMAIVFDTYQTNILKVMKSDRYKKASDYDKAQMLCEVRARLSGEVQSKFKHWLRTSGAKRTYRKGADAKAKEADVQKAKSAVDKVLGSARTYKQFNDKYGY